MTATAVPVIRADDPLRPEVAAVVRTHLDLMQANSPPGSVHALPLAALAAPDIRFFSLTLGDQVAGVGALRLMGDGAAELKSMHTLAAYRGQGLGAAMVGHLLGWAAGQGIGTILLETGSGDAHAAARRLYARFGFAACGPFGDYGPDPHSYFMRLDLPG